MRIVRPSMLRWTHSRTAVLVSAAPWLVQPRADDLQDLYLAELGEEGLLPRE
jgi:hypothetical protein